MRDLMTAIEHYAQAMKLAERHGNEHGDVDMANAAWYECKRIANEIESLRADITTLQATNTALATENERLRKIEAAAKNLVAVKGRYHTEQAMQRLMKALGETK